MSNTPIKTAEEILDSAIADHASKMPLEDSVYRRMVTSNVSYLMVNKSIALAAMHQYHSQFEGRGEGVRELMMSFANLPYSTDYDAGVREGYNDCIDKVREAAREVLAESPLPSTKGEDSQIKRLVGIIEDNFKRQVRLNMPGVSTTHQEERWQQFKTHYKIP